MIRINLSPIGVKSVRVDSKSDLEEDLTLIALRAIRPLIHEMDALLQQTIQAPFSAVDRQGK